MERDFGSIGYEIFSFLSPAHLEETRNAFEFNTESKADTETSTFSASVTDTKNIAENTKSLETDVTVTQTLNNGKDTFSLNTGVEGNEQTPVSLSFWTSRFEHKNISLFTQFQYPRIAVSTGVYGHRYNLALQVSSDLLLGHLNKNRMANEKIQNAVGLSLAFIPSFLQRMVFGVNTNFNSEINHENAYAYGYDCSCGLEYDFNANVDRTSDISALEYNDGNDGNDRSNGNNDAFIKDKESDKDFSQDDDQEIANHTVLAGVLGITHERNFDLNVGLQIEHINIAKLLPSLSNRFSLPFQSVFAKLNVSRAVPTKAEAEAEPEQEPIHDNNNVANANANTGEYEHGVQFSLGTRTELSEVSTLDLIVNSDRSASIRYRWNNSQTKSDFDVKGMVAIHSSVDRIRNGGGAPVLVEYRLVLG